MATAAEDTPSAAEFLAHAYLRRGTAGRIVAIVFAASLLIAAVLPAHYRAIASLAVLPSPEFTVRQDAGSHAFTSTALAFDQIMEAETAILRSDDLHEATILKIGGEMALSPAAGIARLYPDLDPRVMHLPLWRAMRATARLLLSPWRGADVGSDAPLDAALRRFDNDLRVLPTKDSNVINVQFVHDNPVMAARALNLMLASYADKRRHLYTDPQLATAQRQADAMARTVQAADRALTNFKAARGVSDASLERDLLLKRRSQTAQALADARSTMAQAQARLGILDRQIVTLPASAPLYQENDSDTRLQTLDASLVDLRGRMNAAREHYRDDSHLVLGLKAQIEAREAERRRMISFGPPSVVRSGRSPALDPLLLARAQAASDREAARAEAGSAQEELGVIGAALRNLDADEAHLADLTRRREVAADAYAATSRAVSEQNLSEAEDDRRLANVRIIQPARAPAHQTATRLLIASAGLVMGMLAAGLWLMACFAREATFLTASGLEQATGLPVLAVFAAEDHVAA